MAKKSLTGTVVSDKMDKTVIVVVQSTARHRLYRKIIRRSRRYMAHDDKLEAKPGDTVRIVESRPLSRHKRWRVVEIVQRGETAEIQPREVGREYLEERRERQAELAAASSAAAREAAERRAADEEAAAPATDEGADADIEAAEEAPAPDAELETEAAPAADVPETESDEADAGEEPDEAEEREGS